MLPRDGTECCGMPENLLDSSNVYRCDTFIERELGLWLERDGEEIDPYETDSITIDLDYGLGMTGTFVIGDGQLKGLRTVHRSGECHRANNVDERMRFNLNLGVGALKFESECGVKIGRYQPPTFQLHCEIDYLDVFMDFCYNMSFGLEAVLHGVELREAKNMKVWISGLGFCDRLFNPFIGLIARWCKKSILGFIENEVNDEISDGLYTYQFPYSFIAPNVIRLLAV